MPSLPSGSDGDSCDPGAPSQPADGDHGQLMTTTRKSKIKLPTTLARPSQRWSVAARVKLTIHQNANAVRRSTSSLPEPPSRRSAARTLVASARPLSPARPAITIKTHRARVVEPLSPFHFQPTTAPFTSPL